MRGRKPKPSRVRELEGNPGKRAINQQEPDLEQLPAAADTPPIEFEQDLVAAAEWARLMPLLRRSRVITEGDRGSLLALCQQWSRYLAANGKVADSGMVVRSPSGYPMPNPYIGIANKALGNCLKLWVELGLTPSARSRVQMVSGGAPLPDDAFAEFDEPLPTSH